MQTLGKITTQISFLAPEITEMPELPKVLYVGTDYDTLYKANEPIVIMNSAELDTKIVGGMNSKISDLLEKTITTNEFNEVSQNALIVQVQPALPVDASGTYKGTLGANTGLGKLTYDDSGIVSTVEFNEEADYQTNYSITLTYDNTAKTVTYDVDFPGGETVSGIANQTVTTDKAVFAIAELGFEVTITFVASSIADLADYTINVDYYEIPDTVEKKLAALEIALYNLIGFPVDYIVVDEFHLGHLKDSADITDIQTLFEDRVIPVVSTVTSAATGALDISTDATATAFYKINDYVLRLQEFAKNNSNETRMCQVIAPSIQPENTSYSQIKKQYNEIVNYASTLDTKKIRETYGQHMIVVAMYNDDLEPLIADIFNIVYNIGYGENFYDYKINGLKGKVFNVIPYRFAEALATKGYIFAKKIGTNLVIPFLRTFDNDNKTSVRTVKLIQDIANRVRDISQKYKGKPNNAMNRYLYEGEINKLLTDNYVGKNYIAFGQAKVKPSSVSTIGALDTMILIKDYYEIKDIYIYLNYQKVSQ